MVDHHQPGVRRVAQLPRQQGPRRRPPLPPATPVSHGPDRGPVAARPPGVNVREPAMAAAFTPPVMQLSVAPELAALALLEAALEITSAALVAAQPELMRPDDFAPSTDSAQVAARRASARSPRRHQSLPRRSRDRSGPRRPDPLLSHAVAR